MTALDHLEREREVMNLVSPGFIFTCSLCCPWISASGRRDLSLHERLTVSSSHPHKQTILYLGYALLHSCMEVFGERDEGLAFWGKFILRRKDQMKVQVVGIYQYTQVYKLYLSFRSCSCLDIRYLYSVPSHYLHAIQFSSLLTCFHLTSRKHTGRYLDEPKRGPTPES